jgi:hypothetical protein
MKYHYIKHTVGPSYIIDQSNTALIKIFSGNGSGGSGVYGLEPRPYSSKYSTTVKYELKEFETVLKEIKPGIRKHNEDVLFSHYPELGY